MEQEDRDKLHRLHYHVMGNGGLGLLQRISLIEESIRKNTESIEKHVPYTKCEEHYNKLDARLDALEDAQMVSKMEMKSIMTEALTESRKSSGNIAWKILNLLFGGGVIFAIGKAVGWF